MSMDEHVLSLLSTFEIWSTKAIVDEILFQKNIKNDVNSSFCTLMNVPGDDCFSVLFSPSKINLNAGEGSIAWWDDDDSDHVGSQRIHNESYTAGSQSNTTTGEASGRLLLP